VEAALIAGLAGVLGLIVGRFWDSHSEARRWRRDQRIRTYEEFAGAYYKSREGFRRLAMTEVGTIDADEALLSALDTGIEFNRVVVAVWLYSSAPVSAAVREVHHEIMRSFFNARERTFTWDEWRVARSPAERALERFVEAVRAELSLPRAPVEIRIFDQGLSPPGPD
jgi:hypothetical protein